MSCHLSNKRLLRIACVAILLVAFPSFLHAQELNCRVEVNTSQIGGTNKSVFETLQTAISDYVNTSKWTDAKFSASEKIDANMFFTITGYDGITGRISGSLQVQSVRPVYNSSYTTTLINFKDDKIDFEYKENEPLLRSDNAMESQLTAILDFYVYLILAVDFDSFSQRGGEPYFERLETLVHRAQSSGETGWKAFEDTRNRSAVLRVFTDPTTCRIRDLYYQYHINGLDRMALTPDKGRGEIDKSLDILSDIYDVAPMSVGLSIFKDAKFDELANIYSKSLPEQRRHVCDILTKLYPTEHERIDAIRKGNL